MGAKRRKARGGPELFIEQSGQPRLVDKSVEQQALEKKPIECLGMVFNSEEARPRYRVRRLAGRGRPR